MEYKKLKELGVCTQCKKRKAEKGKVKCKICLEKDRIYRKEKKVYKLCSSCGLFYPHEEMEGNICYICSKENIIKKIKE